MYRLRKKSLSLRSRRERKAWGVSPREKSVITRSPRQWAIDMYLLGLSLAIASLDDNWFRIPGAHAPGCTLHACFAG